jgi:hypothetical protein
LGNSIFEAVWALVQVTSVAAIKKIVQFLNFAIIDIFMLADLTATKIMITGQAAHADY